MPPILARPDGPERDPGPAALIGRLLPAGRKGPGKIGGDAIKIP